MYLDTDFGAWFNHSSSPNARLEYDPVRDIVALRLLVDIPAGTEITIDYGPLYQVDGVFLTSVRSIVKPPSPPLEDKKLKK